MAAMAMDVSYAYSAKSLSPRRAPSTQSDEVFLCELGALVR